jgi:hypothetical protein
VVRREFYPNFVTGYDLSKSPTKATPLPHRGEFDSLNCDLGPAIFGLLAEPLLHDRVAARLKAGSHKKEK